MTERLQEENDHHGRSFLQRFAQWHECFGEALLAHEPLRVAELLTDGHQWDLRDQRLDLPTQVLDVITSFSVILF